MILKHVLEPYDYGSIKLCYVMKIVIMVKQQETNFACKNVVPSYAAIRIQNVS